MKYENLQFSGAMPGGHGSASFDVEVENAYLEPPVALREGAEVEIVDNGHPLYEGEILSVKPNVAGGVHKLSIECGGLLNIAQKREDFSRTWTHRGSTDWIRLPGTPDALASISFDNGVIDLRVPNGATEDFSAATAGATVEACFILDNFLSDDTISYLDWAGTYDVATEGGHIWYVDFYASPDLV
ncbi:MAG: hypothetical protein WC322_06645, partial [Candidatus Paceibacterota bacterium]